MLFNNEKVLKFHINNSSYIKINASLFKRRQATHLEASQSNKHWRRLLNENTCYRETNNFLGISSSVRLYKLWPSNRMQRYSRNIEIISAFSLVTGGQVKSIQKNCRKYEKRVLVRSFSLQKICENTG